MKKLAAITSAAATIFSFLSTKVSAEEINLQNQTPEQFNRLNDVKLANIPGFIITLLLLVGIVISIAFLIYGGIKWILSGGDSKQVEGARNHIVAAIVGLIIVIGAFVIISLVFQLITGQPFNPRENLCIPSLNDPTGGCKTTTSSGSNTLTFRCADGHLAQSQAQC